METLRLKDLHLTIQEKAHDMRVVLSVFMVLVVLAFISNTVRIKTAKPKTSEKTKHQITILEQHQQILVANQAKMLSNQDKMLAKLRAIESAEGSK